MVVGFCGFILIINFLKIIVLYLRRTKNQSNVRNHSNSYSTIFSITNIKRKKKTIYFKIN